MTADALSDSGLGSVHASTSHGDDEHARAGPIERLVKELRLEGISSLEGANAFMPRFMEAYNARFGKAPRNQHDAHRPLRADEDLELIFAWRELRKVTQSLTLHYERQLYLLGDTPANRRLIGKYLEIFQFPDGRVEIRVAGRALPYSVYEKLGAIDQGAIVENKRLGHTLQVAQLVQAKRDSRAVAVPSTAHRADGTRIPRAKLVDSKTQRELGPEDMQVAITTHIANVSAAAVGASDAPAGRQM
jgi:hypothetical protein